MSVKPPHIEYKIDLHRLAFTEWSKRLNRYDLGRLVYLSTSFPKRLEGFFQIVTVEMGEENCLYSFVKFDLPQDLQEVLIRKCLEEVHT